MKSTYSLKEACEFLHISETALKLLVDNLEIVCAKVGREYVFRHEVLEEYLIGLEREQADQRQAMIAEKRKPRVVSAIGAVKRKTPPALPMAA